MKTITKLTGALITTLLLSWTAQASTGLGAAVGAAVGAAIGEHNGGRDGAILGGAIGGAIGAGIGNDIENSRGRDVVRTQPGRGDDHRDYDEECEEEYGDSKRYGRKYPRYTETHVIHHHVYEGRHRHHYDRRERHYKRHPVFVYHPKYKHKRKKRDGVDVDIRYYSRG